MPGEYGPGPEESKWKPEQPADDSSEPIVYDISSLPNSNQRNSHARESEARAKLHDIFEPEEDIIQSTVISESPVVENTSPAPREKNKWQHKVKRLWHEAGEEAKRLDEAKFDQNIAYEGTPGGDRHTSQLDNGANVFQVNEALKKNDIFADNGVARSNWPLDGVRDRIEGVNFSRQHEQQQAQTEAEPGISDQNESTASEEPKPEPRVIKTIHESPYYKELREDYIKAEGRHLNGGAMVNLTPDQYRGLIVTMQEKGEIPEEPNAIFDTTTVKKMGVKAQVPVRNGLRHKGLYKVYQLNGHDDMAVVVFEANEAVKRWKGLLPAKKNYVPKALGIVKAHGNAFDKHGPTEVLREAINKQQLNLFLPSVKRETPHAVPSMPILHPNVMSEEQLQDNKNSIRAKISVREDARSQELFERKKAVQEPKQRAEQEAVWKAWKKEQAEEESNNIGAHNVAGAAKAKEEFNPIWDMNKEPDFENINIPPKKTPPAEDINEGESVEEEASNKSDASESDAAKTEAEAQPASEPAESESKPESEAEPKEEQRGEYGKVEVRSTSYMETKTGAAESQDAIIDDPEQGLGAVLDGMGGHSNGREAAHTAAAIIKERLQGELDPAEALTKLKEAADEADEAIRKGNNSNPGGTTLAVVKRVEGGNQVAIAWAGDSRVYRVSGDGELEMLTLDDSKVQTSSSTETPMEIQERMSSINSQEELDEYGKINTSAAENFKRRNVVRGYLGLESKSSKSLNTRLVDVKPGDKFIITSDGVHDNLTTSKIKEALAGATDAEAARALVLAAKDVADKGESFRAKPDDVSAVVMSFEAASAPAEEKVEPRPLRPDGRIEYSISGSGKEGVSKFTELMERAKAANPEFDNLTEQGELIMTQLSKSKVKALAAQANTKGEIRAIENELWDRDISDAETSGKHRRFKREQGDLKTTDTEDAGGRIRLEYLTERRKEIAKQKHIERLKQHQAKKKALGGSETVEQSEEIAEGVRPEREEPAEVVVEDEVSAEDDTVNLLRQIDRLEGLGLVDEPEIEDLYDEAKRDGYIIENDAGKAEATDKPGANEVFEGLQSLYERQTEQLDEAERLGGEFERALQTDDVEEKERALNEIVEAAVQAGLAKSDNNGIFGMSEPDDSILASRWFMRQIKDLVGRGDVATDDGVEVAPTEAEQDEEMGEAVGSSQALSFEEAQLKIQEQLAKQAEQRAARIKRPKRSEGLE